jgi:hypothetical protein
MVDLQEKKKIKKKFENRFFQIARFLGGVPLKEERVGCEMIWQETRPWMNQKYDCNSLLPGSS